MDCSELSAVAEAATRTHSGDKGATATTLGERAGRRGLGLLHRRKEGWVPEGRWGVPHGQLATQGGADARMGTRAGSGKAGQVCASQRQGAGVYLTQYAERHGGQRGREMTSVQELEEAGLSAIPQACDTSWGATGRVLSRSKTIRWSVGKSPVGVGCRRRSQGRCHHQNRAKSKRGVLPLGATLFEGFMEPLSNAQIGEFGCL